MAGVSLGKGLALAAAAFVIAAIAIAFLLIEGPGTMRALRIDERRAGDLDNLSRALDCYWTLQGALQDKPGGERNLPADLETLVGQMDTISRTLPLPTFCSTRSIVDPETGESYRYRAVGGAEYELCATFARASEADTPDAARPYPPHGPREWRHDAGEHCFRLTAKQIDLQGITDKE